MLQGDCSVNLKFSGQDRNLPVVHGGFVFTYSPSLNWDAAHGFSSKVSGILRFVSVHQVQHNSRTASVANQLQGAFAGSKTASISIIPFLGPAEL